VYLGQAGLLGGMPSEEEEEEEEEDAKPPAKRPFPNLEDAFAGSSKKARDGERCVRQDSLEALGKVAQETPGRVSQCLSSLRAAAKDEDENVRLPALSTFGAEEWKRHFGDVGSAPSLPSDIGTVLGGPCPFWPGKKVRDTHLLVLIPASVNGAPFTLDLLGALIQHPKNGGHQTQYRFYDDKVRAQLGAKSADRSYWLLMTRDVLEGSRAKGHKAQRALVAGYAKRTDLPYTDFPYRLPRALEAAAAMLTHYARTGERLFGDRPWTYTRCQEQELASGAYPVVVGGFESSGLPVYYDNFDDDTCGVACCRKLKVKSAVLAKTSIPALAFGAVEWKHYLGDVGSAPALPSNIDAILSSPCPFWPGKKVRNTHLLVLIPASVDGAPFTLNLLGELIQHPKNTKYETKYRRYDGNVKTQLGEKSPDRSYWLLITRMILEGSRNKSYSDQKAWVAGHAKKIDPPYILPSTLEAAAAMLTHHARTGERLFGDRPWTYTRCRELVAYGGSNYPVIVGGFGSSGLFVVHCILYGVSYSGVAGCRQF
jgi:hypothetical protein